MPGWLNGPKTSRDKTAMKSMSYETARWSARKRSDGARGAARSLLLEGRAARAGPGQAHRELKLI